MPQAWMVRAGERGKVVDAFSRGVVAIDWRDVGDLTNVTSREAIRELYLRSYPNTKAGRRPGDIAMLFKFRSVIRIGDNVVSYDPRNKEYLVGSVASDYFYDPSQIPGYPHIRKVTWEGRIRRDRLPLSSRNSLGSVLTIFTLDDNVWTSIVSKLGSSAAIRHDQSTKGKARDDFDYRQFTEAIRTEASKMSEHYELFYCLEKSIRTLVSEKLASDHGADWWDNAVPLDVLDNVKKNIQREQDAGVTRRSKNPVDYATFGELGDIVRKNWPTFNDTFNNQKAFTRIMNNLNVLRAPIAHCCPLADDELDRLRLTIKDWFRLME
jgi:hypothetical protein